MATDESTPAPRHKLCTVDQCGDVVYAKGLCQKHYRRWRKHGDALYERPKKESQPKCPPPTVCSVEGCGATHYGQGHCQTHYNRWKAHGDPLWMPTHGVRRAPAPVALRDAQTQPSRVGGARAALRTLEAPWQPAPSRARRKTALCCRGVPQSCTEFRPARAR